MVKRLKIGIVGCGAIGTSLAKVIAKDFSKSAKLEALYDIDNSKACRLSKVVSQNRDLSVRSLKELIVKSELVIESAKASDAWDIARKVLQQGRDILVMSVGGIASSFGKLSGLAKRYKAKVYLPSGAIAGIDALKAAASGRIKKVILTTRKNPVSFKGVKYIEVKKMRLDRIKNDRVLFSGSAKEAVKLFPQNINVASVLSIAGIGGDKTRVRIIASPAINKNIHEIEVESPAGKIFTRTENVLHPDNPKTSYLAVLSAIATLRQILEPIKIGT